MNKDQQSLADALRALADLVESGRISEWHCEVDYGYCKRYDEARGIYEFAEHGEQTLTLVMTAHRSAFERFNVPGISDPAEINASQLSKPAD